MVLDVARDHSAFIYKIKQRKIILCGLITLENDGIIIQPPNKTVSRPLHHLDNCHFHQAVALLSCFKLLQEQQIR
jgi:hypothetical protein